MSLTNPIVKVCGMREAENIRAVESLGISMMGFIFWEHSPRFVAQMPEYLPCDCRRVGVFVNSSAASICRTADKFQLDNIQLHGNESPKFCQEIRDLTGRKIIKAISIESPNISDIPAEGTEATEPEKMNQCRQYEGTVDMLLFDTKTRSVGGSGEKFNWSVLDYYTGNLPYILSGGIGPGDVKRLLELFAASHVAGKGLCLGFDINSRFELSPGYKDVDSLRVFLQAIKSYPSCP